MTRRPASSCARAATRPLNFKGLTYVSDVEQSKQINDLKGPLVIISASGMAETGRILHHLKNNIEDPRNTVMIVSYQAPDTLGRRLVEGQKRVRIFGEEYKVRAEVCDIEGLSAHAGQDLLLRYALAPGEPVEGGHAGARRAGAGGGFPRDAASIRDRARPLPVPARVCRAVLNFCYNGAQSQGEVPERPIGAVSKTVVAFGPPWVRIPPSPLFSLKPLPAAVRFEIPPSPLFSLKPLPAAVRFESHPLRGRFAALSAGYYLIPQGSGVTRDAAALTAGINRSGSSPVHLA